MSLFDLLSMFANLIYLSNIVQLRINFIVLFFVNFRIILPGSYYSGQVLKFYTINPPNIFGRC